MIKKIYIIISVIILFSAVNIYSHIDNYLLPEECGSCHTGHGLTNEPMLSHSEEELCYLCHSTEAKRTLMKSSGRLSAQVRLDDIEQEFNKMHRHPVLRGTGHKPGEKLDGLSKSSVNHAECVDCHNPHSRFNNSQKFKVDVSGLSLSGQYLEVANYEYELCFKCHAPFRNINNASKNMRQTFSLSNKSQHSVTKRFSSKRPVSLKQAFNIEESMKCSDCHSNDDPNGPKGPHGSRYKYLLSGNYDTDIFGMESGFAYQFCYSCHDRTSILSNESFPYHKEHIVGDFSKNISGTSCYTCHASHSSVDNEFLIEFNREAVSEDVKTGFIRYSSLGNKSGECYLTCHNHSHSPARY